jgi:hypothetical protein
MNGLIDDLYPLNNIIFNVPLSGRIAIPLTLEQAWHLGCQVAGHQCKTPMPLLMQVLLSIFDKKKLSIFF